MKHERSGPAVSAMDGYLYVIGEFAQFFAAERFIVVGFYLRRRTNSLNSILQSAVHDFLSGMLRPLEEQLGRLSLIV